jgi:phospholipid/cholesterol/gamma-HCH transport system substrate-binding protein
VNGRGARIALALVTVALLVSGLAVALGSAGAVGRTRLTAYFDNSTGIYPGDEVRILGVPVGRIDTIEPQPQRAKVSFWVDGRYKIPAEARAVILSPSLVTARALELTPVYTGGPELVDNAVIPQDRTAVPVEWDDFRAQLEKLSTTLQPTQLGGVSTLGAFVDTVADNLRGRGGAIRDTVIKLSQTLSALGDHSSDLFGSLKNLSILVSALRDSTDLLQQLNGNLAAVTALLANDPNEIGAAVADLNTAVSDVHQFLDENHEALGTASDKLAEVAQAVGASIDDVKQALHVLPSTLSNFINIYEPAHSANTGGLSGTNFSNPIEFLCGAIQAASRLGAEQSAKLCVQYLAPIVKNRQYNFLGPIGFNGPPLTLPIPPFMLPFPVFPVGAQARPNEVTFSEDWLRPDYVPPAAPPNAPAAAPADPPLAAEAPPPDSAALPPPAVPTDATAGLRGMMVPGGGS